MLFTDEVETTKTDSEKSSTTTGEPKKRPAGSGPKKPGAKPGTKSGAKPGQRKPGSKPPVKKGPKRKVDVGKVKTPKGLKVVEQIDEEAEEKKKKKKGKPKRRVRKPKPNIEELKPKVASKVRLKKKNKKEFKLLEKNYKKTGRPITKGQLRRIKKGLEVDRYKVTPQYGLTFDIIDKRIEEGLININLFSSSKSYKMIFLTNIFTFFNFILFALVGWLITVGAWTDLSVALIIAANIILGIYQEIKAKLTVDRLSILSAPTAFVMREGEKIEIATTEVVLDDVIVLEAGNQIIVDSIVIDGYVEVNESMLTGESDALVKKKGDILYGGSYVVSGSAKAQVEHIGKDNYVEKLTNQVRKHKKPKSELSQTINLIIRTLAIVAILVGFLLFYIQYINGDMSYRDAVRNTTGAMVGMLPAGLVLISSVALYLGVIKLAEYNVLVRELHCIEMLARISVLCLDKTGTITDGTMKVEGVIDYKSVPGLTTKGIMSAMLNSLNDRNSTSKALEEKFGLGKRMRHDAVMPFSSVRKYSAVDFGRNGTFVLGAPEIIMAHNFAPIQKDFEKHSKRGFRLLLLAYSKAKIVDEAVDLTTFSPVAVILIEDNIRPDAIETIAYFKNSGVKVKVISGDNPMTVSKISERAGIDNSSLYISLDGMNEKEVIDAADKFTVFGRVSPAQKRLLVKTMKSQGETVAMTGDGVNDILALKEADCSIAVGNGADAAKAISHLVLLDSDFSSMPRVVREGRRVINNIARVATLFLTRSIFSLFLAIQAIQSQGAYPITPIQFLMIDILVIYIPSLILILEPNNATVEGSFLWKLTKKALPGATAVLTIALIAYLLRDPLNINDRDYSTIVVITATFSMMMVLFDMIAPLNKARRNLMGTIVSIFALLILVFPFLFGFSPLTAGGSYWDDNHQQIIPIDGPEHITFTQNNMIIINNHITQFEVSDRGQDTATIFSDDLGNYFVRVFGQDTDFNIKTPQRVSNMIVDGQSSNLVLDAFLTTRQVISHGNVSINVRRDGYVVLTIGGFDYFIFFLDELGNLNAYNLLPAVGRSTSGHLTINNNITTTSIGSVESVEIIPYQGNRDGYLLHVNGSQDLGGNYFIPRPLLSYKVVNDEYFYAVGGKLTDISDIHHLDIDKSLFTIDNEGNVLYDNRPTDVNVLTNVNVEISRAGYWVFDGIVSNYRVGGGSITAPQLRVNEDNRLVINGQVTHFVITVRIIEGGMVPQLPLVTMLFMFTLCIISLPLVRTYKIIIPWTREQIDLVKKMISSSKE